MHPSLLKLMLLNWRAMVRRILRSLKRPRGILFVVIGIGFLGMGLLPMLLARGQQTPGGTDMLRHAGPMAMLGLCLLGFIGAASDKAVYFKPAEVDFLFPGPYRRRELLIYRLTGLVGGVVMLGIFLSLWIGNFSKYRIAAFVGCTLAMLFIQLFHMSLALLATTLDEQAYTKGRRIIVSLVFVLVALAITQAGAAIRNGASASWIRAFSDSLPGAIILAPFHAFAETMASETFPDFFIWGGAGLLFNLILIAVVLLLDANFLEASTVASQKLYARVQRMRRTGWAGTGPVKNINRRLPMFPRWQGVGLLAWRHCTAGMRQSRMAFFRLLIFALAILPVAISRMEVSVSIWMPLALMGWITLFSATQLFPFDFRADLDQMDWLKTLPLPPAGLALGELCAPVMFLSTLQCVFLAILGAFYHQPQDLLILLGAAVYLPVMNTLVFVVENVLFLLFPNRIVPGASGFHNLGRNAAVGFLKMFILMLALAIAAGAGGLAWMLAGRAPTAFWVATWGTLVILVAASVPLVAWAFNRFDPGSDSPQ